MHTAPAEPGRSLRAGYNQRFSLRRARAVRSYLVSRGYPSGLIQAVGKGAGRPVSGNDTAEGRAKNRRVEIVVKPNLSASLQ